MRYPTARFYGAVLDDLDKQEWMEEASCANDIMPERWFIFGSKESVTRLKAICKKCPVMQECREFNDNRELSQARQGKIAKNSLFGFFAMETPDERYRRRKENDKRTIG